MIEVKGNLWDYKADARVITTNGTVRKDGHCVMGRGCALEAQQKDLSLPKLLGTLLKTGGNHVYYLGNNLYTFPVKHNWYQRADPVLIKQSAEELVAYLRESTDIIVMPRPGCGNGGLKWDDVKLIIGPILDDRFHVITF